MQRNTIFGSGEMADLIRRKDWAQTPLGDVETWSPALLSAVNMALAVPTPVQLFWGAAMTALYNDAFIPILTHKHPAALGMSARELWAEVWPSVGHQLEAVYAEGLSFDFRDLPLQILNHGELVENHYSFTYSPLRDIDGSIAGLLNLSQNTTATVESQQQLRQSERRFRTLVHSAGVGIAIGTVQGELTYMNPALLAVLNYSEDDIAAGRVRWDALTPARFASADRRAIGQLQTAGIADAYEKAYYDRDGVAVPLLISASVIPAIEQMAGTGDIAVFATDLRMQKRAEIALLQSEKLAAVGKLASSISHEINNPLEAVTNLLYIVQQDPSLSQAARDFLGTADRELVRMSQITSQTLRFHRQSTRPRRIQPKELLEELLLLYTARLRNFDVEAQRDYRGEASLTCYEGDIRQVLSNLITNAVDAMRVDGGKLLLRTRAARRPSSGQQGVLITVADNGTGMPPEARRHLFDAFYTTKGAHGTGLGLWISCRIVHKHRGYIRCYSSTNPRRHGTVFHLWLPCELASSARESWHENGVEVEAQGVTA